MTTLTSPHDLLAAIPFLIGYHPTDSLVLVSIKDDGVGMAMRVDYPMLQDEAFYDAMAAHCSTDGAEGALIVVYQPQDQSDGDRVLAQTTAALSRAGIAIYFDHSSVMTLRVVLSKGDQFHRLIHHESQPKALLPDIQCLLQAMKIWVVQCARIFWPMKVRGLIA
jgi:hypothetical protein